MKLIAGFLGAMLIGTIHLASAEIARAADDDQIDCADTDFALRENSGDIKCFSRVSRSSFAELFSSNKLKFAEAWTLKGPARIFAVDIRAGSSNVYFERVSLHTSIKSLGDDIRDLKNIGTHSGFETAEYVSGSNACVGFRRIVNQRERLIRRFVVGHACSPGKAGFDDAYAGLADFIAAGD